MAQVVTNSGLTPRQQKALECLINRLPEETLADVSNHAGVSLRTLHRYMREKNFSDEFRLSIAIELASSRGKMAAALIRGGLKPGPGQAAMQKLYWQLIGDIKDLLEISGPGGGPIPLDDSSPIPLERLSIHAKGLLVFELSGGKISPQLADGIMGEIEGAQLTIRPECKMISNGS
jgi:hypothetical protein